MKTFHVKLMAVAAIMLIMAACSKETDTNISSTKTSSSASDFATLLARLDFMNTDETADDSELKSTELHPHPHCFTITVNRNADGAFWPHNWTVDYGTANCLGYDSVYRRGKINVNLTAFWKDSASIRTVTYDDFFMNDEEIGGVFSITNNGKNENGNLHFTLKHENGTYTKNDTVVFQWNMQRESEMVAGANSPFFADDQYLVNGVTTGIERNGLTFTATITTPLLYNSGCYLPVSGVIEVVYSDGSIVKYDYGTGVCDRIITVTANGETKDIEF